MKLHNLTWLRKRSRTMKLLRTLSLLVWVLLPGCSSLTGPAEAYGYVGGSLSLSCHYDKGYEENAKFWCKKSLLTHFCAVDNPVKGDRFFIRDNKEKRYFNVTMVKLKLEDAGVYQCGIERSLLLLNIRHSVQVTVLPDPTLDPEEKLANTEQPHLDPTIDTTGIATFSPSPCPTDSTSTPLGSELYIWIYCIILLFILLLLAVMVLVVVSRKKRTGSCLPRKKEINLSNRVSTQNTEDALSEEPIPDHPPDADLMGLYRIVGVRPENNNEEIHSQDKASEKREEAAYATLVISDRKQEAIYDNVGLPSHTLPQPPAQEEVIYTEVAKKPDQ